MPPPATPELATLVIHGRVARLTLNRPESRNALSPELLAALHARVDDLAAHSADPATAPTVLALSGEGKAFCAGMDLKLVLGSPERAAALLASLADLTLKIRALPCVSLAIVNGAAIGGGCGLSTVCDLSITHADAKLGFPEVDLGVCPAVVAPWLVAKIGHAAARRVLLSGGLMSGLDAHAAGIVTHVVPTLADLAPAADAIIARLATGAPQALAATKRLLNDLDASLDPDTLRRAAALSAQVLNTPESQAMLRAKLGA
ncbi:MAG: enoyl-CoA hydratase/isomerase family protein [Phycisphaerae bacterium]|nr:enoyl-CoA hydratase/isomerase family protein [Phycisphaerae bacterium]